MKFRKGVFDAYYHYRSVAIAEKVIVIESDDWGSLRTESIEQRSRLNAISKEVTEDRYVQLDGLASASDLVHLFETLASIKNGEGISPSLTANVCVANPDFKRIKENGYNRFYFEPFHETTEKQEEGAEILKLWNSGQENMLFRPQLHGREHLHALAWLVELRKGNKDLTKAFELSAWGIPYKALGMQRRANLQAALDQYDLPGEKAFQKQWLRDATQIFQDFFSYRSATLIPPAYIWHSELHQEMSELGIKALQGIKTQRQPSKKGFKNKIRFIGERESKSGMLFFPRNVFFEPSLLPNKDWYSETLSGIKKAFDNKLPAIIGSHRINFIGKLNEKNRTENLSILKQILSKAVELYPDVKFISSDQLPEYMIKQKNKA